MVQQERRASQPHDSVIEQRKEGTRGLAQMMPRRQEPAQIQEASPPPAAGNQAQMEQLLGDLLNKIQSSQQAQLEELMGKWDRKIDALHEKIADASCEGQSEVAAKALMPPGGFGKVGSHRTEHSKQVLSDIIRSDQSAIKDQMIEFMFESEGNSRAASKGKKRPQRKNAD